MDWPTIPMATVAQLSKNPIRRFLDQMPTNPQHPVQPHVPLSLGDPTVHGNFALPPSLVQLMQASLVCVNGGQLIVGSRLLGHCPLLHGPVCRNLLFSNPVSRFALALS